MEKPWRTRGARRNHRHRNRPAGQLATEAQAPKKGRREQRTRGKAGQEQKHATKTKTKTIRIRGAKTTDPYRPGQEQQRVIRKPSTKKVWKAPKADSTAMAAGQEGNRKTPGGRAPTNKETAIERNQKKAGKAKQRRNRNRSQNTALRRTSRGQRPNRKSREGNQVHNKRRERP